MADHVESVDGVGESAAGGTQLDLRNLSEDSETGDVQASNFSRLAEDALGSALKQPGSFDSQLSIRESLTSPLRGEVGDEKRAVLSDVERPGTEKSDEPMDPNGDYNAVIDRTRTLYSDLTIYNVAWGVATRLQKDISQLLRGS